MRLYDHPTYGNERPGPGGHVVAQTQAWGGLGAWPSARAPLSTSPKVVEDILAKQPVSTLIQTGVQGIGKLPAVATESAPTSDAPGASRFAMTRPGVAVPVVADQPFQLSGNPPVVPMPSGSYLPPKGTFKKPFQLSGYGQEGSTWHAATATFKNHPFIWGGIAVALGCCLWKKLF
jgi:hypothetical protein